MLSALCLFLAAVSQAVVVAQPRKVLLLEREEIKMGKLADHEREANRFVQLLAHAKSMKEPTYNRIGMTPIAGNPNEVTYIYFYDSLDEWAKSQQNIEKWTNTPGPMKTFFDKINEPYDGGEDLHTSQRSLIAVYQPELSYNPRANIGTARYLSVTTLRAKPGHYGDFLKVVGMYISALKKMKSDDHFAVYEVQGGAREGLFLVLSSMPSLAEMDAMMERGKEFPKAMGDKLGEFEELVSKSMDPSDTVIYAFRPTMSHPPDEIVKADPTFWSWQMPPDNNALTASKTKQANGKRRAKP